MRKNEESSSNRRARTPLLYVALGAIFLLTGVALGLNAVTSPSDPQVDMLLLGQVSSTGGLSQGGSGLFSSQVRSGAVSAFEPPELILFGKTSVKAIAPPQTFSAKVLGALIGDFIDLENRREIIQYVVEEGDTVASLAERFGVSTNTILWANDLTAASQLQVGKQIVILPVSGALHLVRPGDTPSEIALWYKADMEEILYFNEITDADQIFVGDLLVIPNGTKPAQLPAGRLVTLPGTAFIKPVPSSFRITQGLHPFNAIDFGNGACGGPVYAAAGGIVQRVGYDRTAGNYVRILHPSGVVTFYGHLSGQAVTPGESVGVGQTVGYVGHSGYTIPAGPSGCHLHFEVRGAVNPFAK